MDTELDLDKLSRALKGDSRRRLVRSILVIAVLLLPAASWFFLQFRSQERLEADQQALAKQTKAAEELAKQAVEENVAAKRVPNELSQAVQAAGGSISIIPRPAEEESGYLVVLGSTRELAPALQKAHRLRLPTRDQIRLFWAINGYYAPVVGILKTREEAIAKQRQLRSVVPDAYIFGAWAFPYELVESK